MDDSDNTSTSAVREYVYSMAPDNDLKPAYEAIAGYVGTRRNKYKYTGWQWRYHRICCKLCRKSLPGLMPLRSKTWFSTTSSSMPCQWTVCKNTNELFSTLANFCYSVPLGPIVFFSHFGEIRWSTEIRLHPAGRLPLQRLSMYPNAWCGVYGAKRWCEMPSPVVYR